MQNINLLSQLPTTEKTFFTINKIKILFVVIIIFWLILYVFNVIETYQKFKKVEALNVALEKQVDSLTAIKKKYPLVDLQDLEGSTEKLKKELAPKSNLSAFLSSSLQFSSFLNLFSNTIISGVWLTEINILEAGREINLKGIAIKATLAQEFLNQLRMQSLFASYKLILADLTKNTDKEPPSPHKVNFIMLGKLDNEHV